MTTTKIPVRTVYDSSNNPVGLAEYQVGEVVPLSHGGTAADSVNNARINLNITESNIRALFTLTGGGTYNNTTGVFSINDPDFSPYAKTVDLTTANVTELTNLYFTNTRADVRVAPAYNQANIATSIAQAAFNSSNTKTISQDLTTANVVELNNLYFTNARAIASLVNQQVTMGEATITGNLFVLGNVVEFNTETLVIEDKNIFLANGSPNAESANGAGITVDGANASLSYDSDTDSWNFNKDLNVEGSIAATGNITSPFYYSESDVTLKENIHPIDNPLKKVLNLFGVSFDWKINKQKSLGVIAQEVEKVVPEIVSTSSNGTKIVSYDSMIPLLIEAIKEQQLQINELRKKIK